MSQDSQPDIQTPISADSIPATVTKSAPDPIIARSGQYYRNTRYIMTAVTIIMGFWFLYDGFVRYPVENEKIKELKTEQTDAIARRDDAAIARINTDLKSHVSHSETDLLIQRILAFALPPAGLLLLLWALYNSRGEYRLSENILYVPGHPPVPLDAIQELDETQWDRKGIATVRYTIAPNTSGRLRLDDFVYNRVPTDKIVKEIQNSMESETAAVASNGESDPVAASPADATSPAIPDSPAGQIK